jgi:mannosyltransferase OCH1-like enzyme
MNSDPSENDTFRSNYIFNLLHRKTKNFNQEDNSTKIPKLIIQYWHDMDNIPKDVKECLTSWAQLTNQGYKLSLFDDKQAQSFIFTELGIEYQTAYERCHHPAMRCDYFRLCYLFVYGGIYIDADEYLHSTNINSLVENNKLKVQPLCYDISTDSMISSNLFLAQKLFANTLIFYVNNNPLIAPPKHPLIELALKRATDLLLNNSYSILDIQSTTGPGNLSASLVKHAMQLDEMNMDFDFIRDWDTISESKWPLSYRNDNRNWRLWNIEKLNNESFFR